MTKEQVMAIARESGCPDPMVFVASYLRFATLVRNAALEEAAEYLEGVHQSRLVKFAEAIRNLKEPTL